MGSKQNIKLKTNWGNRKLHYYPSWYLEICQQVWNFSKRSMFHKIADLPRQQVYELWLGHPVRQDARNGGNTCPEQVDLGFPFTTGNQILRLRSCKRFLSVN